MKWTVKVNSFVGVAPGAVYTCKEVKGRLVWLQTRNGSK